MRTNDQYFQPGDKVMRVEPEAKPGTYPYDGLPPKMGVVYCVSDFWEGPEFNVVMLTGFGGFRYDERGRPVGWRAIYFRKVEEIKICLQAVAKVENNVETPSLP